MTRVRVATAADADRIGEIHDAAIREHGPTAYDDEQVAAWRGAGDDDGGDSRATPADDDHWIVAECDVAATGAAADETAARIVGWGRIDVEAPEISGSYVHPDHARSGVGSTIVAALEGYARGQDLEEVELLASKNAIGFYERLGYERVAMVEHDSTDAVTFECLRMRKDL